MTQPEKESLPQSDALSFEKLCDEAHKNAANDRRALKKHLKRLKQIDIPPDSIEGSVLVSDAVTKTSDALSKANAQIIQVAQLLSKSRKVDSQVDDGTLSEDETDKIYEQIDGPTN